MLKSSFILNSDFADRIRLLASPLISGSLPQSNSSSTLRTFHFLISAATRPNQTRLWPKDPKDTSLVTRQTLSKWSVQLEFWPGSTHDLELHSTEISLSWQRTLSSYCVNVN